MSAGALAYNALVHLALPAALARLYLRARREPAYREHVAERFGRYRNAGPAGPVIWLHAVSVGETRAAEPLVDALLARYPGHALLVTHMTPTGRRTGEALFGDRVLRAYLPYDYPAAVARFLGHFRPSIGLIMETEVWPNLIATAAAQRIPVYLVNARLSEKSFRHYARFAAFMRSTFAALAGVAAQTARDAERVRALGATRVQVTGNVKFDVTPQPDKIEQGLAWRARYGVRPVVLAASTRDGEEALLLNALSELAPANALFVIVPRHPQRFDEVAALLESRGVAYARRSRDETPAPDVRVLLGDTMGEMAAYYAACDLAFVGGSLLPFGGQNLIEACALGKPVLIGPHTYNFADAAESAIGIGAAVRVDSAAEAMRVASALLADSGKRERMGESGRAFSRAHQGATQRVLEMLERDLSRS